VLPINALREGVGGVAEKPEPLKIPGKTAIRSAIKFRKVQSTGKGSETKSKHHINILKRDEEEQAEIAMRRKRAEEERARAKQERNRR